jgi:PAS domain S-box-containing protein
MQEGVWVIDAEGITTFVNPRMAEMLGYREKEMIGKPMYDFMAKDMIPLSKFYLNRKAQGVSEQFEFQYLKRNGEPIDCVLETSPVYDENHRFIGALRCVTDITEYKKKEKIFREQEETLRITFDHSSYAIVTTTIDGRIVQFNHTFSALLGYSEKELQNRSMQTIIHQTDYEFNLNLIRQAIEKHLNILSYELRFILKDGTTIWGDVKTSIIFDDLGNPEYLVTLIRDITNRKNDEIETIAEEIARVQVEQEKSQIDGSRTLRGILFKQSTKIE